MLYQIAVSYTTGDSFRTEEVVDEVVRDFKWANLDIAKENLRRIKEHYAYYQKKNDYHGFHREKVAERPEWHKKIPDRDPKSYADHENLMLFKLDNGEEVQFWPSWIGYFEHLHGARIVNEPNTDSDMEIYV